MEAVQPTDQQDLFSVERALLEQDHCGVYDGIESLRERVDAALGNSKGGGAEWGARWQLCLAGVLRLRFEVNLHLSDLDQAQRLVEGVLSSCASEGYAYTLGSFHLARIYQQRFEFFSLRDQIVRALDYSRHAKSAVDREPRIYQFLRDDVDLSLGASLVNSPLAIGTTETQLEGIALLEGLLSRLGETDSLKPLALYYLSDGYRRLASYQPEQKESLIARAMELGQDAYDHATPSPYNIRYATSLADFCYVKYSITGNLVYIYDGISICERAIALVPEAQHCRGGGFHLRFMAELLSSKFEAEGLIEDLDAEIKYHYAYIDTGPSSPYPYGNLCNTLCSRFRETGNRQDIDNAIRLGTIAVELCFEHDALPIYPLLYLGVAYTMRFLYEEDRTDYIIAQEHLEAAIKQCHELAPRFESALAYSLETLATLLYSHYRIHHDAAQLDLAIVYLKKCLDGILEDAYLPRRLSLLGECLLSKAMIAGGSVDLLEESLSRLTLALDRGLNKSRARHLLIWRRGRVFRQRFEQSGHECDFDKAVQDLRKAIQLARTANHPKQSAYMAELAGLFEYRFSKSGLSDRDMLKEALDAYDESAANTQSFIVDRFQAGLKGGELAMGSHLYGMALKLFTVAVQLIPRIAWLGMNASRRHAKLISSTSALVCDTAAAAIISGELERAVELLEEGRAVLWKSMLDLQADVSALRDVDPSLADELVDLGKTLEYDDLELEIKAEHNSEQRAQRRRRMAERWDSLLVTVRGLAGFESFLLPSPFSSLRAAATDGPIVIFNASRFGSHALIIQSDSPVRCVPLPAFASETLGQVARLLSSAIKCTKDGKGCMFLDAVLLKIGRYLWSNGVSEVAQTIAFHSAAGRPRRVWLLPTGLFSLLPIHCAGLYEGSEPGLSDMFILSHTTTLSSLLVARKGLPPRNFYRPHQARLLAVFQPEADGLPMLEAASEERKRLAQNIFPGEVSYLFRETATIEAVKRELPLHNWFHCCAHGRWRTQEPLDTALRLYDGSVRLFDLLPLRLKSADFAVLSACHTARHGPFLPDESLHLAAALQVAGFRGVLATAWAMADCDGPVLTELFYRALGAGGRAADPRNAAEALQTSVRTLRDAGVPLWRRAAFVHYGV